MRILIIEDDNATLTLLKDSLEHRGFAVDLAKDGELGLKIARLRRPDLLIVNVLLRKKDGLAVVRHLRHRRITTPLILLTAHDRVRDCVKAFEIGADDYLVKPFAFAELLARVRSLLRRHNAYGRSTLWIEDLEINTEWQTAVRSGITLRLTRKEFLLLSLLARSRGKVVSHAEIASHIWGSRSIPQSTVAGLMRHLRAKVDYSFYTKLIHTVRGAGYTLTGKQPSSILLENNRLVCSTSILREKNNLALTVANS
jgi:two-component system copper resistance phosphate regulon response regulator CusR